MGKTRFEIQAAAQAAKPATPVVPPVVKKEKSPQEPKIPKGKPPGWLPKAEYLAKLAAERKAAANPRTAAVRGHLSVASTPIGVPARTKAKL